MDFILPPWKHQLEALARSAFLHNFALFFEMGTGKTGTAINIIRRHFNEQKKILKVLIFCPPIVIKNWKDEFAIHSRLEPGRVHLLNGSGKRRASLFSKEAIPSDPKDLQGRGGIFVTNYETLLMDEVFHLFQAWAPDIIIFDESHRLKNHSSLRAKAAYALANPWSKSEKRWLPKPHTYLLSGTPILNSPMDIFMQYKVMDGGESFGRSFTEFRARYFRDRNAGMSRDKYFPDWRVRTKETDGFDAMGEISTIIDATSMRAYKKDCLDLPPLIKKVLQLDMTPEQARMYREMKRDFITFMNNDYEQLLKKGESNAVVAQLAITKALRLMQITSGYIKTAEGKEIELTKTEKESTLADLLSELTPNHKVLVWAVWQRNYDTIRRVCASLNIGFVENNGTVAANKRDINVTKFNTDPSVRVFLGHPGSGGIGVNLVSASYSIFYSRNFSLEQSLQAEARNHRGGSEIHPSITRIDLVCKNTLDELILEKLANKEQMGHRLLKGLAKELESL